MLYIIMSRARLSVGQGWFSASPVYMVFEAYIKATYIDCTFRYKVVFTHTTTV